MGELLGPLEDQIVIFFQTFSPHLDLIFGLITLFGDKLFIIGLIGILFYCIDKELAIQTAFLVIITEFINTSIKGIFGLERPYIANEAEIKGIPDIVGQLYDDYTFPSGHSSNAGALWTFLANKWRHPGFWALAIFMIVSIPLSRCYLGMHYPTDIIAGVLLGTFFSLVFVFSFPKIKSIINKANPRVLTLIAIIIPITGVVLSYALTIGTGHQIQQADPSSMGGLLVGVSLGYMLEEKYVNLKVRELRNNKNKILIYRAILGLIIFIIVYFGLSTIAKELFPEEPLTNIARFCRYAILGFIGIFCAPWLFNFLEQKLSLHPGTPTEL